MASGQDSGMTLMDLITSDPSATPPSSSPAAPPTTLGKPVNADRKPKKVTLSQIQSDTISAAKALNPVKALPQRQRKKLPVSYAQLARSIHEFAATADQKSSQKKLVHHVFPKLAVYNSVDPSLAPSLLMVGDAKQKRKKGIFNRPSADKESNIQNNLQYAAISALRRFRLDPGNPAFLHRAIQGVSFTDPVAVRHSLAIISDIATRDPYFVAMALDKFAHPGGALQDILHLHDVLARVSLARFCYMISRARSLDERPDIKSQFNSILYQLLLDPSDRVCFEAILCVSGKFDNTERTNG